MQYEDRIFALKGRAAQVNLTLAAVCREAEVNYSIVWRWMTRSVTNPKVGTLDRHLSAIEAVISKHERSASRPCRRVS